MENPRDAVLEKQGLRDARLFRFETLPSTQDWAQEHKADLRHGDVVWARRQTMGRGRFGRHWLAANDGGLAFSVLLKSANDRMLSAPVTQAAAVAVCATLQARNIPARMKWPNDVLACDRKIAGILAECFPEDRTLVLGIGINANMLPCDFASLPALASATSLRIETGQPVSVRRLLNDTLDQLELAMDRLVADGTDWIASFWARNDALAGRRILVRHADGKTVAGLYRGMTPDGALLLECDDRSRRVFWSGEVGVTAVRKSAS